MAFCGKCGTQLSDGAKFCPKCGEAVGEVANDTVSKPKARKPKTKKQVNSGVNKLSNTQAKGNNMSSDTSLSTSKKIGLGITSVFVILCLFMGLGDGMIVLMLACLCALVAIVMCYIGSIESQYSWWVVICSIFVLLLTIGATAPETPKKFEAVEDGRAAYSIDSAHYENSDVQSIRKIVMYEGNDRQDCKAEGINGEGQYFAVDGKWEKKEAPNSAGYYYFLDYNYFKLLIRDDSLICYYKGKNEDISSINHAWADKQIGKIADLTQEEENKISAEIAKEKERIEKEYAAHQKDREKQDKIKKVAEMAYQKGYKTRRDTWGQSITSKSAAHLEYTIRYGREPEDEGQSERWKVFLENYEKGFSDAADEIMNKMREEDF